MKDEIVKDETGQPVSAVQVSFYDEGSANFDVQFKNVSAHQLFALVGRLQFEARFILQQEKVTAMQADIAKGVARVSPGDNQIYKP